MIKLITDKINTKLIIGEKVFILGNWKFSNDYNKWKFYTNQKALSKLELFLEDEIVYNYLDIMSFDSEQSLKLKLIDDFIFPISEIFQNEKCFVDNENFYIQNGKQYNI